MTFSTASSALSGAARRGRDFARFQARRAREVTRRAGVVTTTLAVGATATVGGLASSVLAVSNDSAQIDGAVLNSLDYEGDISGEPVAIEIAEVDGFDSSCDDASYSDTGVVTVGNFANLELSEFIDGYDDLGLGDLPYLKVGHFCLRHAGTSLVNLHIRELARTSTEISGCGTAESTAEENAGLDSCNAGDVGELGDLLELEIEVDPDDRAPFPRRCNGFLAWPRLSLPGSATATEPTLFVSNMGPAATCNFAIVIHFGSVGRDDLLMAVDDRVVIDLEITAAAS